jgi:DNA mismatch repair protein MutL
MPKVHILKPEIISKIAAGEVIERPASVIKELIENAIDAGADNIDIELKDAGKSLIRVKDNGHGIDQDDLETIFQRHATSKISNEDDLYAIRSLGFRGEALYSIAAVSHVTARSKTGQQDSGWSIHLRGGEHFHIRPCAFQGHGTEMTIKELFFNTPARKKFLKSNTSEIYQVLNTLIPYALQHHETRFSLTHGEKTVLDAPPSSSRIRRMADTLNLTEDHLLEVHKDFPEHNMAVRLILGDINIKRSRRDMQFIFVNNRPVQNKSVGFHLNQVYRLILMPGLYPCFAAYITVPAEDVDVNIHPSKREVKIKNEQEVCAVLRALCEQTLMSSGQIKQASGAPGHQVTGHSVIEQAFQKTYPSGSAFDADAPAGVREPHAAGDYAYPREPRGLDTAHEQQEFFIPENSLAALKEESLRNRLKQARLIGTFMDKFLLFERGPSLLMVDQHAAAERINYEQLIRQMEKGGVEAQHLLSPVLIPLTPQETLLWDEAKDKLERLGLSTSPWDNETIAVHTHPLFLKNIEPAIRHLLAGDDLAARDHDAMARRACRSSVMAGDKLSPREAEHIRDRLLQCLDPFTCPHGRPTVIEMTENFLDKQFSRT